MRHLEEKGCNRTRGCKPETEAKYSQALELYATTGLSYVEICRKCGISVSGFSRYIRTYHRHLMLKRNGIICSREDANRIGIGQRRGQRPETHAKYKEAIRACDSMEYIECNVSQIAREFGLSGTNLGKQLSPLCRIGTTSDILSQRAGGKPYQDTQTSGKTEM